MVMPTRYTRDLWDVLCDRIACGESLRSITRDPTMPDLKSIWRILSGTVAQIPQDEYEHLTNRYSAARACQADTLREDIQEISDNLISIDEAGQEVTRDANAINASRVRIDARKWIAERQAPRKWGNKMELSGPDGGPLQVSVVNYCTDTVPK